MSLPSFARLSARSLAVAGALAMLVACSVSTANISSAKLGKDKAVTQETTTFAASDPIYGAVVVSNNPGKVTVKGRLVIDVVEGQTAGPIPGLETVVNLDGSGTANFTFSPSSNGWPVGKYKFETMMLDEAGTQKDQKTINFEVK